MTTLQERRIAKGLCPNCGNEAAPYRLCPDCRARASLGRMLRRGEKFGVFKSHRQGREKAWSAPQIKSNQSAAEIMKSRPMPVWGEGKAAEDGRLQPRLGNIPVDVEAELIAIFERIGEPLTEEEIWSAWGKLRVRRGRASAAGDLAALVKAERRRARKNRKRARMTAALGR